MENRTARILMCRPDHFSVSYSINPWMDPVSWGREAELLAAASRREWRGLVRILKEIGARIELVPPVADLPDLVFTANAAVVMDGKVLLARFRHPERQREEMHFARSFHRLRRSGALAAVASLPPGMVLEGAGDCVWDAARKRFWMGYGQRSDRAARDAVAEYFGIETVALELADPRFYHMDTALNPLSGGELLYVPQAFTAAGRAEIEARVAPELRLPVPEADAVILAANAVCIGRDIVLTQISDGLKARLEERGYRVHRTPLAAFARSGGSAFCLTLRLDHRSGHAAEVAHEPALAFA